MKLNEKQLRHIIRESLQEISYFKLSDANKKANEMYKYLEEIEKETENYLKNTIEFANAYMAPYNKNETGAEYQLARAINPENLYIELNAFLKRIKAAKDKLGKRCDSFDDRMTYANNLHSYPDEYPEDYDALGREY